jgi:hypothetical protein
MQRAPLGQPLNLGGRRDRQAVVRSEAPDQIVEFDGSQRGDATL